MSNWIEKNTTLKKRPFSFHEYEFQRQIADDMHPDLSCIKCSQIGLTEVQLRKYGGFLKRNTAVTGIFTLPNDKMYKRVSQTRFKPLMDSEPVFNQGGIEKPIRSMGLYQIDQSFGYFTGNTEGDATSISADMLVHDEVDLSDPAMLGLFQSRLQNSDFKITQGFSTPTFVGFGIDAKFKASDQHEYLCRCTRCNHWNDPVFTPKFICLPGLSSDLNDLSEIDVDMAAKIALEEAYVRCEKCSAPLDLGNPSLRQWVAKFPSRRARGYRVRPFATPRLTVPYIVGQLLKMKQQENLRGWYNTVLGEPYNDSNARLSEADVRAVMAGASKPDTLPQEIGIGIDVGQICHLVYGTPDVVFGWEQIHADKLVERIKQLGEQYTIVTGALDRHPYTPTANELRDSTHGRIAPVEYRGAASMNLVLDEFEAFSHVQVNRTQIIDAVVSSIRKKQWAFTGYTQYERLIIEHLQDMVRIESAEEPAKWQKLTGNDHFFHALGFLKAAFKLKTIQDFQDLTENRIMSSVITVNIPTHNESHLGLKRPSGKPISIGLHREGF
ncbi:hypothetical protein IZ6_25270 [Terrihabitans soli]|uniref:Phage terminase large subunit GpA ATPase domain-containing protein n=1 Tax=Terrihabitans soli TaxID=708113 RepID=A0A6S6QX12_9HYPH|nr:phage terminase large subunit family protein [Terrihabitans soli]BCJ91792.1 hypothetical protein IZ6_25270 [Terrihabitans soli]